MLQNLDALVYQSRRTHIYLRSPLTLSVSTPIMHRNKLPLANQLRRYYTCEVLIVFRSRQLSKLIETLGSLVEPSLLSDHCSWAFLSVLNTFDV